MRIKCLITPFLLVASVIHFSYSQVGDCKVLKPEIAGIYSGDCKKGLANGKGIAEGIDKYEGKFKDGLPHGNGTYQYANGEIYQGDFKNVFSHQSILVMAHSTVFWSLGMNWIGWYTAP